MAMNEAGVAIIALAAIATQDIQKQLTDEAVIVHSILNLTDRVSKGMKSIAIPRVSGMAATTIPDSGSDSTSAGTTYAVDVLTLTNFREVADYIYYTGDAHSSIDLENSFFENAPGVYVEDIESRLYLELDGASATNPDHILQMSGAANEVPTLADLRLAAKLLDEQKLPQSERFLVVTPAIKHALMAFSEVSDASKFGQAGATINGWVGRIYGFDILVTNQVTAHTCVAYHKSAMAFAFQNAVEAIVDVEQSKARKFVAVRGNYGQKVLALGKKCVLLNKTGT